MFLQKYKKVTRMLFFFAFRFSLFRLSLFAISLFAISLLRYFAIYYQSEPISMDVKDLD